MKYYTLLCPLLLLLTTSCRDKEEWPVDRAVKYNTGSASALVNGNAFISTVTIAQKQYADTLVGLNMSMYIGGIERRNLYIAKIAPKVGRYKLVASMMYIGQGVYIQRKDDSAQGHFYLSDDDVLENSYDVFEPGGDNYIDVESYDAGKATMKGTFHFTAYRSEIGKRPQTQGFPDTLRITDGKFDVTIK